MLGVELKLTSLTKKNQVAMALQPASLLPATGDEPGASGRADGGVGIKISELHAFHRKTVDVRRAAFLAAIAAEPLLPDVV